MTQFKTPRRPGFKGVQVVDVHVNVDQEIIQITEDKLRLILKDYLDSLTQSGGWVAPFSILVSIATTFCTAKFETFFGLGPEFWRATFFLVGTSSVVWLIVALLKSSETLTPDEFINKVKNKP
jgi:hypothetical protein